LHSVEAVRNCAYALRSILRHVGVNSGNLEKGLLRIEPNISIRPVGSVEFNTRVEIKNLNSFRSLERATTYELERQEKLVTAGGAVVQQTLGWDDERGTTLAQRSKEVAEDYRYFPEPDLPPLVVDQKWVEQIRKSLPELPDAKRRRFIAEYALKAYDADVLVAEREVAEFYEAAVDAAKTADAKIIANWVTGPLFGSMNDAGIGIEDLKLGPAKLAALCDLLAGGKINAAAGRAVLAEMFTNGGSPAAIVKRLGLQQISDRGQLGAWVADIIAKNPEQAASYLAGNQAVLNFLFGQVMRAAGGKADPQAVRAELQRQLNAYNLESEKQKLAKTCTEPWSRSRSRAICCQANRWIRSK
jgi:aspartyl-tRNA(Asn)/glutamyl-tRNA(Gln) amidotransferase subunit B